MLTTLKSYFLDKSSDDPKTNTVALASAVLMLEISMTDDNFQLEEQQTIHKLLAEKFSLSPEEVEELSTLAHHEFKQASSIYDFVTVLNQNLSPSDKNNIIYNLWQIAYADSVIHKYEEYTIRKIADLLYVEHKDYIKAKLTAGDAIQT